MRTPAVEAGDSGMTEYKDGRGNYYLAEGKREERKRIRQGTLLELVGKLNKSAARVDEHFPDVLRVISEMYEQ
jgi:hypothetical protein